MTNIWSRFQRLSYKKDVRIGTVTAFLSGGLSKLTDVYGQTFTAVGQSVSVASKAYVEDGVVVGEAPTITEYTEYV